MVTHWWGFVLWADKKASFIASNRLEVETYAPISYILDTVDLINLLMILASNTF